MIKQLFFTAALLAPSLAYAGIPSATLPGQIVPAGSVPAPAAAAGFTTQVLNADFTSPAYSNPATFVDNCGATTPLRWYWVYFLTKTRLPCGDITAVSDGTNPQVLSVNYTVADFRPGNGGPGSGMFEWPHVGWDLSEPCNVWTAGCLPIEMYSEVVMRIPQAGWDQGGVSGSAHVNYETTGRNMTPTGGLPHNGWFEADYMETIGNTSTTFGSCTTAPCMTGSMTNCPADCSGGGSVDYYTADLRQYHTLGFLVTSDESTNIWLCKFLDGVLIHTCVQRPQTDAFNYTQHDNIMSFVQGTFNNTPNIVPIQILIQSVKVWTCPNYQTTGCPGTMVTHWPFP